MTNNDILQLIRGELVLNTNGNIYYTDEITVQFKQYRIENKAIINDIKKLVCQHLNLQPSEVIFSSKSYCSFDFIVRFDGQNEWKVYVCDNQTAINNTREISDEEPNINYNDEIIGLYRRLGDSPYYFRWFNDI